MKVDLLWTKDGKEYSITDVTYTDAHLKQFYEGYANGDYAYVFRLTVNGTDAIDKNSLCFNIYYETERGVKLACKTTSSPPIYAELGVGDNPFA